MSLDSFHVVPPASQLAILCALAFGLRVDPALVVTRSAAAITAADFERAPRLSSDFRLHTSDLRLDDPFFTLAEAV